MTGRFVDRTADVVTTSGRSTQGPAKVKPSLVRALLGPARGCCRYFDKLADAYCHSLLGLGSAGVCC